MLPDPISLQYRTIGRAAAWAVFSMIVVYAVTTALGFLSLKSSLDPIGDPYFAIMELLILLMTPLMVVIMVAVHYYAPVERKLYSLTALAFMIILAGLTDTLHFVILSFGRQVDATGLTWMPLLISFKWPSVAYALDILAWDIFFPLSFLFAAPVFKGGRLETWIRILMILSAILSFAGLAGVPFADMQYRNIGIIGYALVAPVVFLLIGILFGSVQPALSRNDLSFSSQAEA